MVETGDVAEDQTGLAADDVKPNRTQNEADKNREQRLRDVIATQTHKGREGQHHEGEYLR